jgi:enterochelin esterase family protein
VHHHFFRSGLIGDQRDFVVYTPPGYAHRKGRLPVLYLLHGYSDSAIGWTEVGKAHVILDNLIAAKKAKPMIVVMPLGYGVPGFGNRNGGGFSNPANVTLNFERFRASLLTEVMPIVENEYRVDQRRESRAIAGLSMGGAETLFTGLPYSDKFAYVGAFSTGGLRNDAAETTFKDLDAKDVNRLKVFWMVCGTDDGLIDFQRGFADAMKKRGVNVKTKETPGGHVWMLWRRNLAEFAQMLFR